MNDKKKNITAPILFLIFNRPDTTEKVFNEIRKASPSRLFIASDGPRENRVGENAIVEKTREFVLKNIDWDCEVKTLFREKNLGCKVAVSSAIDWFFENVKEGIILEDDCLPSQSFFKFCNEMLEKYRDDMRIWHIAGNNFHCGWKRDLDYSYYFSYYGSIWGWATWASRWNHYDVEMKDWKEIKRKKYLFDVFGNNEEVKFRINNFDNIEKGFDTWDFQWVFTRFINYGLSIIPEKNLVKNLGFRRDATHTISSNDRRSNMDAFDIKFPLNHPTFVIRDKKSDDKFFRQIASSKFDIFKNIINILKR